MMLMPSHSHRVTFGHIELHLAKLLCGNYQTIAMIVSKKGCKDQESIQSSTTPDPGYQWESDKLTV